MCSSEARAPALLQATYVETGSGERQIGVQFILEGFCFLSWVSICSCPFLFSVELCFLSVSAL